MLRLHPVERDEALQQPQTFHTQAPPELYRLDTRLEHVYARPQLGVPRRVWFVHLYDLCMQ
jgi:hypothetical protein